MGSMPSHRRVQAFASRLAEEVGYDVRDEVEISRVVLLTKPGVDPKLAV
jgi:wyosine [tRNA(Phe)-imidazoG37] synthetase (radical SAM superfamily)